MSDYVLIKTIESLERLNCSVNGNPRYRITFTDGSSAVSQSDAGFCYSINNQEFRDVPVKVTFIKNRNPNGDDRIRHIEIHS